MLEIYQNLFTNPRHLIPGMILMWLGLNLSESLARKRGENPEQLSNLVFYFAIAWVLGGRLAFAALNLQSFIASPISLIYPNTDMFNPIGAWVIGFSVAYHFARKYKLLKWEVADSLTPFLALTVIGVAMAHLADGKIYGTETKVLWAISQLDAQRHPWLIYELLASLGIFSLLWPRMRKQSSPSGSLVLTFMALTSVTRLFIEAFRGDGIFILGGFRLTQVFLLVVLGLSLYLLHTRLAGKAAETT